MRFILVIHPQYFVPPDALPALVDGFAEWWERYREKWESAGFFAGGSGGGSICNVANEGELFRMMQESPFSPFSEIKTYSLVDMDTALDHWQAIIAAKMQT